MDLLYNVLELVFVNFIFIECVWNIVVIEVIGVFFEFVKIDIFI